MWFDQSNAADSQSETHFSVLFCWKMRMFFSGPPSWKDLSQNQAPPKSQCVYLTWTLHRPLASMWAVLLRIDSSSPHLVCLYFQCVCFHRLRLWCVSAPSQLRWSEPSGADTQGFHFCWMTERNSTFQHGADRAGQEVRQKYSIINIRFISEQKTPCWCQIIFR